MEVREGRVKGPGYTAEEVVRWAYNKERRNGVWGGAVWIEGSALGFTVNRDYINILKQRGNQQGEG